MISNLPRSRTDAAAPPTRGGLPPLRVLATAAFAANAPFVAFFLLEGKLHPALSFLGGLGLGLVVYTILYFIVTLGTSFLAGGSAAPTSSQKQGQVARFAGLTAGKFIFIGMILYVLIGLCRLSLLALVGGFLLTQIAVTVTVISRMAKSKVTD